MISEQEISKAQQDLKQTNARLSNFLNYQWQLREKPTPEQIAAHNAVKLAIDGVVARMETLKEVVK